MKLSDEPKIVALASALKLRGSDATKDILEFCRREVARLIKGYTIRTIWDLDKIICDKLNLVIHEIWNDDELRELSHRYAMMEPVFAALAMELNLETYGILYQRTALTPDGEFQYVAFIDCRGFKAAKRWFTRWHEIAHRLTTVQQFEMPFRRTSVGLVDKDPEEKLMDMIAGEIGFFEPIFRPLLETEIHNGGGRLTFSIAENIRAQFSPDASFHSTLNACAARSAMPILVVECELLYKKTEMRSLSDPQLALIPEKKPVPKLRVKTCTPNEAARDIGFQIPRWMRVPSRSLIAQVFADQSHDGSDVEAMENLQWWTSSDGGALSFQSIHVQVRKVDERVLAIICPTRW